MPAGRGLPLAAGPGHVPEKGGCDRRAAHVITALAVVKCRKQQVLGTVWIARRPGQNSAHDEHAVQSALTRAVTAGRRAGPALDERQGLLYQCLAVSQVATGVVVPTERRGQRKR